MFANSGAAAAGLAFFAYYVMLANPGALASLAHLAALAMLAVTGGATVPATIAALTMLAVGGGTTGPAVLTALAVFTEVVASTGPAMSFALAVLADAGTTALDTMVALRVVRTLLPDAPLDWMRRKGIRCCCRSCCGCLFHDVNGGGSKL